MDLQALERFRREGKTWIALGTHPNIVQAAFIKTIGYKPHIFLEYIDGLSLREQLAKGPLDLRTSLDIILQCCEGMIYAHQKLGIVHRDLKPENILLTRDGVAKITDFGLVSLGRQIFEPSKDSISPTGLDFEKSVMGTPHYMPPEQWMGGKNVDIRSDIYAFGVIFYELLCGRRPFELEEGEPDYVLHAKHLDESPPDPGMFSPGLAEEVKAIVLKCLEKKPERRFLSLEALQDAIVNFFQIVFGVPWTPPQFKTITTMSTASRMIMQAMSLASLDDHPAAIELCDRVLAENQNDDLAWQIKGRSLRALGNFDQALDCLRHVVALNPDDYEANDDLAFGFNDLERYEDALTAADRSIDLNPNNFSSWNNKAIALYHLGRIDQALATFQKVLDLNPLCPEAWNNRGFLLAQQGKVDEPMDCFRRAIDLNPRYVMPYFNLSRLFITTGRLHEALLMVEQILTLEPHNAKMQQLRSRIIQYMAEKRINI